jgi:hypothetical protein
MNEINKKGRYIRYAQSSWIGVTVLLLLFFGLDRTPSILPLHPAQSRKKKGESSLKNLNVKEIRQKDMEGSRKDAYGNIFSSSRRLSDSRRVARQCWRQHPVGRARGSG